jgi:hypothetical protein
MNVDTTMTNPRDWTDVAIDENEDAFNVVYTGIATDTANSSMALVHLDNSLAYQVANVSGTSYAGNLITANGNATINNSKYKFGGGSVILDGNGDYLSWCIIWGFQSIW